MNIPREILRNFLRDVPWEVLESRDAQLKEPWTLLYQCHCNKGLTPNIVLSPETSDPYTSKSFWKTGPASYSQVLSSIPQKARRPRGFPSTLPCHRSNASPGEKEGPARSTGRVKTPKDEHLTQFTFDSPSIHLQFMFDSSSIHLQSKSNGPEDPCIISNTVVVQKISRFDRLNLKCQ